MSYTYDPCHRLKEEWVTDGEGNTISKYVYTLGRAGERTAIKETDVLGNETTISYTYDKLERLTEEKIQSGDNQLVNSYTYDKVSNRLTKETTVTGDVSVLADEQLEKVEIVEATGHHI